MSSAKTSQQKEIRREKYRERRDRDSQIDRLRHRDRQTRRDRQAHRERGRRGCVGGTGRQKNRTEWERVRREKARLCVYFLVECTDAPSSKLIHSVPGSGIQLGTCFPVHDHYH